MIAVDVRLTQPDFGFEATDAGGKTIHMDTSPESGGLEYGIRPMQALLMGLGGCSGIDVVSILKKQRQLLTTFHMHIEGHREHGKVPSLWESVHINFELSGEQLDPAKARIAVGLSIDKYCSVAETLRRAGCKISWDIKVNGEVA